MTNDIDTLATALYVKTDDLLKQYPDLVEVPVPQFQGVSSDVSAAVLQSTTQPTAALRFAR